MSLLIESIKLLDGEFYNLSYHEQRMHRSLQMLCGDDSPIQLEALLNRFERPQQGLYKCRIEYDEQKKEVEFIPYQPKDILTLRIVEHDRINYEFKYKDRKTIDRLFSLRRNCDDVLIVRRGYVTDSSFCNIVFKKGDKWYTPWSALLKGTQRQQLLDRNIITEEDITPDDIKSFTAFKLINAMMEFDGPEIDVSQIVL